MTRKLFLSAMWMCAADAAADPPYAGKWRINTARSDFGETSITYEQLPGGELKVTADGQTYSVRTDGKENKTPWGTMEAWKAQSAKAWEVTNKVNGKVMCTSTVKLADDEKTLNVDARCAKADGGSSDMSTLFQRVSGTSGLAGKWKTKNLKTSSPEILTLTPKADGLSISLGNAGGACEAKFDGRDYPATGPVWPAGWTCVIARNGSRGFELTWKKDGKNMYKSTMIATADGKTLTENGSASAVDEKFKVVYEKQ